ncbi:MAG: hypothetical protein ABW360_16360 [Phenylobacterium sp.]
MSLKSLAALAALATLTCSPAFAEEVTTGVVIRGVVVPGPAGAPNTPVNPGRTCSFANEEVGMNGRMTGASVQCKADGNVGNTIGGLINPPFNAYCVVNASRLRGTVITAPIRGNDNHCDLSAITRGDATTAFGGAKWR